MLDLSIKKTIEDAKYWQEEINQLYHPTGNFEQDSEDVVYSKGNLNITKFIPILLKEWFFLVKEGGYLVIDYIPNELCDWQKLEEMMWRLWKKKYEIIYHGPIDSSSDFTSLNLKKFISDRENYYGKNIDPETSLPLAIPTRTSPAGTESLRFICKKTAPTALENDNINQWTFGIVTNGIRKDWLEDIVKSIRKQGIPEYEILICGTYYDKKEADVKYIPFNKRDDKGWITRKKNIVAEKAKYGNLCIIHDRMYLDDHWFQGMKKWGNCFESLACPQLFYEDKTRFGDWVCVKDFNLKTANNYIPINSGYMNYKDWDDDIPGYAGVVTMKRKILLETPYNETRYWGIDQYEDMLLHSDIRSKGIVLRMNPFSVVYSKSRSVIDYHWYYEFNSQKLGKLRGVSFWIFMAFWIFQLAGFNKTSKVINKIRDIIKNKRSIKTNQDFKSVSNKK